MNLFQENIGVNLYKLGLGKGFLDMTQRVQSKKKIDKLVIKIKNFFASKDTSRKYEENPTENICNITDKELVSRTRKTLLQVNNKKSNNPKRK